ncbi:MAG: hypothetical protein E6K03_08880 [Methanobacteriota archaeon]|nr:MAG: hypothetical protein E6K03_08880 [Euryarchaeota archaeon]
MSSGGSWAASCGSGDGSGRGSRGGSGNGSDGGSGAGAGAGVRGPRRHDQTLNMSVAPTSANPPTSTINATTVSPVFRPTTTNSSWIWSSRRCGTSTATT